MSIQEGTFEAFIDELERDHESAEYEAKMRPSRELAHMLVRLRRNLNLSQREFAARVGVTPSHISRLESGLGNPSIQAISSLLRRAGVHIEFRASIAVRPDVTQDTFTTIDESNLIKPTFSEGETYHLACVATGFAESVINSRVDGMPLDKGFVLSSIAGTYEHAEMTGKAPRMPNRSKSSGRR